MPQDENNKPTNELQAKKAFETAHDVFAADADLLHKILHFYAVGELWGVDESDERQELYKQHYRDGFQRIVQRIAIIEAGLNVAEDRYKELLEQHGEAERFTEEDLAKPLRADTYSFHDSVNEGNFYDYADPSVSSEEWWENWNPDEDDVEPSP